MSESPEYSVKSDDRITLPQGENVLFAPVLVFFSPTAAGRLLRAQGTCRISLSVMLLQSFMLTVSIFLATFHVKGLSNQLSYFPVVSQRVAILFIVLVIAPVTMGYCTAFVFATHRMLNSDLRIRNVFHGIVHGMLPATVLTCILMLHIGALDAQNKKNLEEPWMRDAMEEMPFGTTPLWFWLIPLYVVACIVAIFWHAIATGKLLRGLLEIELGDVVSFATWCTILSLLGAVIGLLGILQIVRSGG